jgi:acyl-CoA synthetase (AMP-forming)/AMP-acid ligase II
VAAAAPDPFRAFGDTDLSSNVALALRESAERTPDADAVRTPSRSGNGWTSFAFARLEQESDAWAFELSALGLRPGDRTCVFVRAGYELVCVTFALLKLGAVPVLIDPGMGRKRLLSCVERMRPRALVGIPAALLARRLFRRAFKSVELAWRVPDADPLRPSPTASSVGRFPVEERPADAEAALLFTSGSTGPAKAAVYSHGTFRAQLAALAALYELVPGEVDVACFPLFGLFDAALGITSVFPNLDPSRPGSCDPALVVRALEENEATLTFGSPAIWRRVGPFLESTGRRVRSLRRILIAGAPVPPALSAVLRGVLEEGADVFTPYGATEALPVASISGRQIEELRGETESGAGTCVGRVAPGIDLRLIRVTDEPLERWSDDLEVEPGETGEICVRGPVVTRAYAEEPEKTRAAKIAHGDGTVWHRMGDVGRLDEDGRLWFYGRKAHRLETERGLLMPVPQENIFNTHPAVRRSAVVGVGSPGREKPVLVVEPEHSVPWGPLGRAHERALASEIAEHRSDLDVRVRPTAVLFRKRFPVDVRHNAKIHREELSAWASERVR